MLPLADTHVHFWDIEQRAGLGWIAANSKILNKFPIPNDHQPIATANGVGRVDVQTRQGHADDKLNLVLCH